MTADEIAAKIDLAMRTRVATWFEIHGAIKPKVGPIIRKPSLQANYLQVLESKVIEFCLTNQLPCRIIKLKPRQKGSSTFSVAAHYRHLGNYTDARGVIIGGSHQQSSNLFKILKTYAENDTFEEANRCQVLDRDARWANGSTSERLTAANKEAGRSGTYQAVLATEPARWDEEGVANAADVLSGLLKCVADAPGTLIELESTAHGASGDFYERWQGGITFEELKAGRQGYVKLFAAWFQFPDSFRKPELEGIASEADYSEQERELAQKWKLSLGQVAWMRWAIREECKRDFDTFCEEYPFDAESAFRTSGRRRFNAGMLEKMKQRAALYPPAFGVLEPQKDGTRTNTLWRPCPSDEARLIRWEPPRGGCKYLVSVDLMTGASQVGSKDPDNHSVGVIRAGMFQEERGWVPPRLVARLINDWPEWERNKKYDLRWDIDVLEEQVWRLAQYYGNCLIVPEMNMDRGLVELLKLRTGARIYQRKMFNRREQKFEDALGWMTDPRTREMIVENLARAIREHGEQAEGVDIHCPITLAELQTFVVKKNGRSEAMNGKWDDNVLQMAIGLMCLDGATVYREPTVHVALPRDLANLEKAERESGKGMAMRW